MTAQEFQRVYPLLADWIASTLRNHAQIARPILSVGFPRLQYCFRRELLSQAKFVTLSSQLPVPPLASWGLSQFDAFEAMKPDGITYLDTYFLRNEYVGNESLHFHELIHVVQWKVLGTERFIALYAEGLEQSGYRNSPLEEMAYNAEAAFKSGHNFDAEAHVRSELGRLYS